jgi:4-alpha-glucanotransferase
VVAGVPPDRFSAHGQRWGNPLYRWDRMEQDRFAWWEKRFRHAMGQADWLRLDHFRGFEAYWEIPRDSPTAVRGRWVKAPGERLFRQMRAQLGPLPFIAEDLGWITPEVESLRDSLAFPGMRVLQFGLEDSPTGMEHRPDRVPFDCAVYTGTHDNETSQGWFHGLKAQQQQFAMRELGGMANPAAFARDVHWYMIHAAFQSRAWLAMIPIQDVLGLDNGARLNSPGTTDGNWIWRMKSGQLTAELAERLASAAEAAGRRS